MNISGFLGHLVSVATSLLMLLHKKAATINMYVHKKGAAHQIWPVGPGWSALPQNRPTFMRAIWRKLISSLIGYLTQNLAVNHSTTLILNTLNSAISCQLRFFSTKSHVIVLFIRDNLSLLKNLLEYYY